MAIACAALLQLVKSQIIAGLKFIGEAPQSAPSKRRKEANQNQEPVWDSLVGPGYFRAKLTGAIAFFCRLAGWRVS